MKKSRLDYLFIRYIDKSCTAEEYQELMKLINDCDDNTLLHLLDDAYTQISDHKLSDEKSGLILNQIFDTVQVQKPFRIWYWLSAVAATIMLITIFSVWQWKHLQPGAKNQVLSKTVKSFNDHRFIRLSDGSTVTLNKNSSLTYPCQFGSKQREVTLIGEGYFDIKHDLSKPFLVYARKLTITVLGTAFNVNTAKSIAVTVTRGRVSVSDRDGVIGDITPGQQISYDGEKKLAHKVLLNAAQAVKWQASDVFFDNVTMEEATSILENRFSRKIRFSNDQIKRCVFSGAFTHNETLLDMIKVICAFNKASYEEKGDVILIKGNGC